MAEHPSGRTSGERRGVENFPRRLSALTPHGDKHPHAGANEHVRDSFSVERPLQSAFHHLMDTCRAAAFRVSWSALTITLLAALVAGCSDKRSDGNGSTTTVMRTSSSTTATTAGPTTESTETSSTAPAEDPVITAYLAFWDMYIELAGNPPPFDPATVRPRLDALTTGAEKAQLFDFLQKNAGLGLVLRGDIDHSPTVVSNDGSVAVVKDCMDDRTGVYQIADESRVDTDDPARHLYIVSLRMEGGDWKVETVTTEPEPCTV